MKNCALFFTITALMLACNVSYAQNSIFAGKIVDENDKPIPGAIIRISRERYLVQELHADGSGLFYSKLLEEARYYIDVTVHDQHFTAKKLFIGSGSMDEKKYYIIRVLEDKVVIDKVDEDPSATAYWGKLENRDPYHTYLDRDNAGFFFVQIDTATGKLYSKYSSGMKAPKPE